MTKPHEVFALPTKEQKESFVLQEVSFLMDKLDVGEIQMSNLDQINLQFKIKSEDRDLEFLESRGYEKTESSLATLYHKFDDNTAVASNVTLDKTRKVVIVSMNF